VTMSGFDKQSTALAFRDWVKGVIASELEKIRPATRYATVTGVDWANNEISVMFPGDTTSLTVPVSRAYPAYIGQKVRIGRIGAERYVDTIVGPEVPCNNSSVAHWSFSTVLTLSDPSAGYLRLNYATMPDVNAIAISHTDAAGGSALRLLRTVTAVSTTAFLTISDAMNPNIFSAVFKVTARSENSTWDQLSCSHVATSGTRPESGTIVCVSVNISKS
jgi:hypothetical protein